MRCHLRMRAAEAISGRARLSNPSINIACPSAGGSLQMLVGEDADQSARLPSCQGCEATSRSNNKVRKG